MISFTGRTRVFAATSPIDLRKSYDALHAFTRDIINQDILSGHIFLFLNRRRNRLKALFWDGTGLVLLCKRLEKRRFTQLNSLQGPLLTMTSAEFALLFEGADLSKRFIESPRKYREYQQ